MGKNNAQLMLGSEALASQMQKKLLAAGLVANSG